jgi:hypothetical protein
VENGLGGAGIELLQCDDWSHSGWRSSFGVLAGFVAILLIASPRIVSEFIYKSKT